MKQTFDRRDFLKLSGLACPAAMLAGRLPAVLAAGPASATPNCDRLGWQMSCSQYTFRRMGLYEALPDIARLGFHAVETGFFLKLRGDQPKLTTCEKLSPQDRAELKAKLAQYGISMASFYSNLDANEAENRKKFEFAKQMGAKVIVAEPPPDAFALIDKLCGEYQIDMAVHNHPHRADHPEYQNWNPDNVLAEIKGHSDRIGVCCDIGHWVRSGLDPVQCLKKMEGRIKDVHLKDVAEAGNPKAEDVPLGQGKGHVAAALKEIHRQGYRGLMVIEYERDSDKLVPEVAQCLAFVEKTAATL